MPQTTNKNERCVIPPPLAVRASKQKHGAGVVRARPPHNYAWLRQNLVRANFAALLKERTKDVEGEK